jgi:ATP synthase subunit 6
MLNTPFEQFKIALLFPISNGLFDLSLTNITVLILFISTLLISITFLIRKNASFIPNNFQLFMESIYLFIFSIVKEQTGTKGYKYFPHFFTIFFVVLSYNCVGLLPFSFTVSSHIIVTLTLSLSYFIAWIFVAIKTLGSEFLYVFYPKNMPAWLLPLLVIIETLSFFLRPLSLGIRLFANMLAGHILLHIIAGSFIYLYTISAILIIPIFLIVQAVTFLELGIAFLQAYIFTILLAIYLKDSLISHNH